MMVVVEYHEERVVMRREKRKSRGFISIEEKDRYDNVIIFD